MQIATLLVKTIKGRVLKPGGIVTIDYSGAQHLIIDILTNKVVTDPDELAKCEEEFQVVREKETRLWEEQQREE